MKKSKIILLVVFVIAALAVVYFAFGVVKNRYLGGSENRLQINEDGTLSGADDLVDGQTANQSGENQANIDPDINNNAPADGQPNVQNTDCDNNCANFKNNADNLKYCQEACGDRPVTVKDSESECESLTGLAQNSCWRDLAVSKLDSDLCDKIGDAKLKKVCKNRVAEELLN